MTGLGREGARPDKGLWKDHTGPDQKTGPMKGATVGAWGGGWAASAFQVWEHLSEEGELALQREGQTGKIYGR